MEIIFIVGRLLYAAIFISSGVMHLTKTKQMGSYAKSMGVPAADLMTFVSGLMILAGGLAVLFDFYTFYGALLIFLFLVPTAFMMHAFWKIDDPGTKALQQAMFMKNISLAGAALIIMFYACGMH